MTMQRFGFVPHRLETDTTDLSHFPRNVLFVSYRQRGEQVISGTALYSPILATFRKSAEALEMQYVNQYCDHCRVKLRYDLAIGTYTGQKFIGERLAWQTTGDGWNSFFGWFTGMGLANGEGCKFEVVPSKSGRAVSRPDGLPRKITNPK